MNVHASLQISNWTYPHIHFFLLPVINQVTRASDPLCAALIVVFIGPRVPSAPYASLHLA
jgi:hypothetical protein